MMSNLIGLILGLLLNGHTHVYIIIISFLYLLKKDLGLTLLINGFFLYV